MKRFFAAFLLSLTYAGLMGAQTLDEFNRLMSAATESVQTLECDFVQTKTSSMLAEKAVMTGHLYYSGPSQLTWEYLSPYQYSFVMSESSVTVRDGSTETEMDPSKSRVYKRIAKMMDPSSPEGLGGEDDFDVALEEGDEVWIISLKPLKKDIKRLFSGIVITLGKESYIADSVELEENGGSTLIEFSNKKIVSK